MRKGFVSPRGPDRTKRRSGCPTTSPKGQTAYRVDMDTHPLTVTAIDESCTVSMSGEAFPSSVRAERDGATYRVCRRSL